MLVLSRKSNEIIKIGDEIEIKVLEIKGDSVRIGIEAPRTTEIVRGELIDSVSETNTEATRLEYELFKELSKKISKTLKDD